MKKTIWFLLDNRMGSVGQARGIMQALDTNAFDIVEKKIVYNRLADLPNFILGKTLLGVTAETKKEINNPPFPDIVVSISRRTVPVARFIKKASQGKTKLVQLMHPGKTGLKEFSLVVVPEHDKNKAYSDNSESRNADAYYLLIGRKESQHRLGNDCKAECAEEHQRHSEQN